MFFLDLGLEFISQIDILLIPGGLVLAVTSLIKPDSVVWACQRSVRLSLPPLSPRNAHLGLPPLYPRIFHICIYVSRGFLPVLGFLLLW